MLVYRKPKLADLYSLDRVQRDGQVVAKVCYLSVSLCTALYLIRLIKIPIERNQQRGHGCMGTRPPCPGRVRGFTQFRSFLGGGVGLGGDGGRTRQQICVERHLTAQTVCIYLASGPYRPHQGPGPYSEGGYGG